MMKNKSIYLFLCIIFFAIPCFSQVSEQTLTTAEGYQLQVTLKPYKTSVILGEARSN